MPSTRTRVLLSAAALAALAAAPFHEQDAVGDAPLPDVRLASSDGRRVSLWSDSVAYAAQVVGAVAPDGPERAATIERLAALARPDGPARVRVLILSVGGAGAPASLPEGAQLLDDPFAFAIRRLGLEREGDVVVVDRALRLRWRGTARGADEPADAKSSARLAAVVDAALAGTRVRADPDAPRGAALAPAPRPQVTYFRDVLPIVRAQCGACHGGSGPGPMDLTDVAEARGWAPMMAEVTQSERMPPWSADPRYAVCRNERHLTDTEKEIVRLYAAQGAHDGAPAADAAPRDGAVAHAASTRWTIGEPDAVWELPHPESIPAEGVLEYRSAVIHTELPADTWVEAIECAPTAPQVLHHLVAVAIPDDVPDEKAVALVGNFGDAESVFGGYVPGAPAVTFPPGCARRMRKGQRLVLSIHYTTNGTATVDRTRVGVRFARGPVLHEVHGGLLASTEIDLAPGAAGVQVAAFQRIDKPIDILAFQVHMHARGAAFRYVALRAGSRRTLFDIPRFDWNWQHYYDLATPIRVEADEALGGIATYDNSAANPRNPDPAARVKNGPQSWDEMMNGFFHYIDAPEPAETAGARGSR